MQTKVFFFHPEYCLDKVNPFQLTLSQPFKIGWPGIPGLRTQSQSFPEFFPRLQWNGRASGTLELGATFRGGTQSLLCKDVNLHKKVPVGQNTLGAWPGWNQTEAAFTIPTVGFMCGAWDLSFLHVQICTRFQRRGRHLWHIWIFKDCKAYEEGEASSRGTKVPLEGADRQV